MKGLSRLEGLQYGAPEDPDECVTAACGECVTCLTEAEKELTMLAEMRAQTAGENK